MSSLMMLNGSSGTANTCHTEYVLIDEIILMACVVSFAVLTNDYVAVLVVNYGISNTVVMEIP